MRVISIKLRLRDFVENSFEGLTPVYYGNPRAQPPNLFAVVTTESESEIVRARIAQGIVAYDEHWTLGLDFYSSAHHLEYHDAEGQVAGLALRFITAIANSPKLAYEVLGEDSGEVEETFGDLFGLISIEPTGYSIESIDAAPDGVGAVARLTLAAICRSG